MEHSPEQMIGETRQESPSETKEALLVKYPQVADDRIFNAIMASANEGWESLTEASQEKIVKDLRSLLQALDLYHDSYMGLKVASAPERRMLQQSDPAKYREAVKNADEREHILHNAFIDAVNILSREMKAAGLSNEWRADEEIYGLDPYATRQKLKAWMFKIYKEEIPTPQQ